ncbi:MAG: SUMF1/EgtB/PvdO family nonheme iron enzyme [Verrucomicrobiales bacterium]|nr:SUMF1/EgtB/PvdO family nonheme iron enzyme [Verrucomicrobiales bacterium]
MRATGSNRVKRGGSWNNNAANCRSANRNRNTPENRNNNLGFRLAAAPRETDGFPPRWNRPASSPTTSDRGGQTNKTTRSGAGRPQRKLSNAPETQGRRLRGGQLSNPSNQFTATDSPPQEKQISGNLYRLCKSGELHAAARSPRYGHRGRNSHGR